MWIFDKRIKLLPKLDRIKIEMKAMLLDELLKYQQRSGSLLLSKSYLAHNLDPGCLDMSSKSL
jgi:hypothetical protein